MKRTIKIICIILILILSLNLFACSSNRKNSTQAALEKRNGTIVSINAPRTANETVPGYISNEIKNPDWLSRWAGCEISGDSFCFVAYTTDDAITTASYDTINGEWRRYDNLQFDHVYYPSVNKFSVAGNSFWVLLQERYSIAEQRNNDRSRELSYYLVYLDISSGEQTISRLDFWSEGNPYLQSFIALDPDRILVGDGEKTFLLDAQGNILEMPELYIQGGGSHVQIGGEIYVNSVDGLALLNRETLQYGSPIEEIKDQAIYCSSLGNFLTTIENKLCSIDPSSGEKTEIFDWMDVALSYRRLYGWSGLENSNGDFFHYTDKLTKVSRGEVPVKETLTLGCLGNASDEFYEYVDVPYTCTESLMDAIVRFNNSDPAYKVKIEPFIYHNSAERDRILIELATNNNIDILDTSLLPNGAVDKQLLVDLLPYIDADDSMSRDDFIPSLLRAMMKNNGLYEYTDKYTMLTMVTHKDLSSKADWTTENIKSFMAQYPELAVPSNQNDLIKFFSWASTAEFMDWETLTCNFDSPAFISWLSLLKALSLETPDKNADAFLFNITYDFATSIGLNCRWTLKDEYTPIGFPNAKGTGSYFMKLGIPDPKGRFGRFSTGWSMITAGCNTSLGMMAASEKHDGAWRFIRTFMLGEDEPALNKGIPVLAENFERAIEAQLYKEQTNYSEFETFNEEDAKYLREIVYNTTQLVCSDTSVIDTLATAINAYLEGNGSAKEAAQQIQRRMSIYMAEQHG